MANNGALTTYTYDLNNRLTKSVKSGVTTTYQYDKSGNQLNAISLSGTITNNYDLFNRLISVEGSSNAVYTYQPDGLRASKTVNGIKTNFHWDGSQLALETTNTTYTKHIRGINLIASQTNTNASLYYLYNAHGDVVQLTNTVGAVTKRYDYDAFGVEKKPDQSDINPWRYCGEYYDRETGTVYLRARYYQPGTGRFTQEDTHWNPGNAVYGDNPKDPMGLGIYTPDINAIRQNTNLYGYCSGNPVMYVDPSGNFLNIAVDLASFFWGIGEMAADPSLKNLGMIGLDLLGMAIPFVSSTGVKVVVKVASKADDVASVGKVAGKVDNVIKVGVKTTADFVSDIQKVGDKYYASKNIMYEIRRIEAQGVDFTKLTSKVTHIRNSTEGGFSKVISYSDSVGIKFVIHQVTDKAGNLLHRDFDAIRIASGQIIHKLK